MEALKFQRSKKPLVSTSKTSSQSANANETEKRIINDTVNNRCLLLFEDEVTNNRPDFDPKSDSILDDKMHEEIKRGTRSYQYSYVRSG